MPLLNFTDSIGAAHNDVVAAIRSALRMLLEDKHLYQSVDVDVSDIFTKRLKPHLQSPMSHAALHVMAQAPKYIWRIRDDEDVLASLAKSTGTTTPEEFLWQPPDIKSHCAKCERDEPFNVFSSLNVLPRSGSQHKQFVGPKGLVQVFSISYLCQSCKSIPEVFLVRRTGSKLQLAGRAPMETTAIPRFIPQAIANYYSGARIAFQSGQTLAALFLLRTACEQWCKPFGSIDDKADVCLDKYGQTLPTDFRDRFPSLKAVYSELSAAIHQADPNSDLFNAMSEAVTEHFEARKLYKLPPPPIAPAEGAAPGE